MAKGIYIGVEEKLEVLDYIESSGAQYIDTGIVPSDTFKIEMQIARTDLSATDGVCGSYTGSQWGLYFYIAATSGKYACAYGDQNLFIVDNSNYLDTNKHSVILNLKSSGLETTVDGSLISRNVFSSISNGMKFYLFKCNDGGTSRVAKIKLYSFKIYDNDILVRDYIPVKRANGTCCLYDIVTKSLFINKGAEDFISGTPTGEVIVNNKAREVKKIYTGIENIARKVIKGYIGIGGTARQFFSSQKGVSYYGTSTPLSQARAVIASVSFNDYAIFAGGANGYWGSTPYSIVETYNKRLTKNTITNLSSARRSMFSGKNENYAIFAGGYTTEGTKNVSTVDSYDKNLTKATATNLSSSRYAGASATINNNILIAGGSNYSGYLGTVDSYDLNLTRKTLSALANLVTMVSGGSNSNYAIFAGGYKRSVSVATVEAYNNNLVKTTGTSLSVARSNAIGVTLNDSAIFAGGGTGSYGENTGSTVIDIYDKNLTRSTPITLSAAKVLFAGESHNDYAIFAGGRDGSTANAIVNTFDISLVRTIPNDLSVARGMLSCATTGDYVLFAGGQHNVTYDTVDVYEIN